MSRKNCKKSPRLSSQCQIDKVVAAGWWCYQCDATGSWFVPLCNTARCKNKHHITQLSGERCPRFKAVSKRCKQIISTAIRWGEPTACGRRSSIDLHKETPKWRRKCSGGRR